MSLKFSHQIISGNLNPKLKLIFYPHIAINNNILLKICCEDVADSAFVIVKL